MVNILWVFFTSIIYSCTAVGLWLIDRYIGNQRPDSFYFLLAAPTILFSFLLYLICRHIRNKYR